MTGFTDLETAVLAFICDSDAERGNALRALLQTGQVTDRENDGNGFFTNFQIPRTSPAPAFGASPISGPNSWVAYAEGAEDLLMGFLLWLTDGYPDCLEGYQYGDDVDLRAYDLAALRLTRLAS